MSLLDVYLSSYSPLPHDNSAATILHHTHSSPFSHVRLLISRPLRLLAFSFLSPLIPGYLKYADFTPDRRVVLCNCSIALIVSWIVNVFQ